MKELLKLKTIPAVIQNEQMLKDMMNCDYLYDNFSLERAESIRKQLRDLMQYLPNIKRYFIIDIPDKIDVDADMPTDKPKSYAEKAMEYISASSDPSLAKIRNLDELTDTEKEALKSVFYETLGTEAEFTTWSNSTPLLLFLRMQVGIADYMEHIIEYAKKNGDVTFMDLQRESPFNDYDIMELFGDKVILVKNLVNGIHKPVQ